MSLLSDNQKNIVIISYWTALGELDALRSALEQGLNQGLTLNEIKEVLVHTYAYAGFPRALNAINTLLTLENNRKSQGMGRPATPITITDKNMYGGQIRDKLTGPRPTAAYAKFVPIIDDFLKEHLFADLFSRDVLSYANRELVTISILASLSNVRGQLKTHMTICYHLGFDKEALADFQSIIATLDESKGQEVASVLAEID